MRQAGGRIGLCHVRLLFWRMSNLAIDEFRRFRYNGGTPTVVGLLYTVSFAPLYTTVAGYFSTLQPVSPRRWPRQRR